MGFSYPKITLSITFKTRRKDNYRPAGVPKSTVHCLKTLCFFLAKKKNSTNKTGLSEFNLKLFFCILLFTKLVLTGRTVKLILM